MVTSTPDQVGFHAMPDSPYLTHTWCGYALLTLQGLSPGVTKDQVQRVTVNGVDHKWRPMGDQTLMLIPSFKFEAQRVVLHLTPSAAPEAPKPFKNIPAGVAPPDLSHGFTAPFNRYRRHPDDTQ
jgi:hypothetical protein